MVPPEIYLRAFLYTVSTYIYICITYVYLCAYVYKDAVKFQDVLWVVAVHIIKTVGRNTIFDDSLGDTLWETPLTKSKKHRKTKKQKTNKIPEVSQRKKIQKSKNLEKTKKNKKHNNIPEVSQEKKHANIKETSRKQKPKKNNILELLPVGPISRLLEYWFFFVLFCFLYFSQDFYFLFLHFLRLQDFWIIVFCFLEIFSSFFFVFVLFLSKGCFPRLLKYYLCSFLMFSLGFCDLFITSLLCLRGHLLVACLP